MKCFIYAFYNNLVKAYEKPIVNNYDPKTMCELVKRDVLVSDNNSKARMKECTLYHLGTYDDQIGLFENNEKPVILLDLSYLIEGIKSDDKDNVGVN